ncbi:MAG TPA: hypothetical protein VG271_00120 [Beijerinckiaceae bacterium]|jgi:hypothetical protein|nr:hypothetical protein [Beijerinckiaceae bacterium]
MSVSGIGATTANVQHSTSARAADGDYLVRSAKTAQAKDADGDYKPAKANSSPGSVSTSAVQAALNSLKKGG